MSSQMDLFESGHVRKSLLKNLPLPAICRQSELTKSGKLKAGVKRCTMLLVLQTIDDFDRMGRGGRGCFATVATIAERCHISERTVRNACKIAASMGLLSEIHSGRWKGSICERRLCWPNIRESIDAGSLSADLPIELKRTAAQKPETSGNGCRDERQWLQETSGNGCSHNPSRESCKENNIIINSSAPDLHRDATGDGDDWSGIVSEIASRGVTAAVGARNAAQRAGLTPRDVRDILQHWDDQGAILGLSAVHLYVRLRDCHPELAPGDGWMPGEVKTHAHAQQAKRDAKPVERQEQSLTAREVELIDSLTDGQVAEAIRDHYGSGAMSRVWQRRAATKITRHHPMIAAAIIQTRSTRDGEEISDTRSRKEACSSPDEGTEASSHEERRESSVRQAAEPAYASS